MKDLIFIRTNGKIINQINLAEIKEKAREYKDFSEFREDILWLVHNVDIMHCNNNKIMDASKGIVKYVDEEIASIYKCSECYSNAHKNPDNSFVIPCKQIHPVVWAKSEGFAYWPAKAMLYEQNFVHVTYFCEHTTDKIPLENCYQYSLQPPEISKDGSQENQDLYEKAMNVC